MTTLAGGQFVQVPVPAGSALDIAGGTGLAAIVNSGGMPQNIALSEANFTLPPSTNARTVNITADANQTLTYSVYPTAPAQPPQYPVTLDSSSGSLMAGGVAVTTAALGPYANSTLLEAAFPAASNSGKHASIGASAPYTDYISNGVAWVTAGGGGGSGDVVGPASSVNNRVAVFSGLTGKLLADSGLTLSGSNTGDQTSVTGNAGTATALATSRNIDGQAFNGTADVTVIAPGTNAAAAKTTPVDADLFPIVDSAASNVLKKLTWANIKATLKTYFDSLATTLTNKTLTTPVINGSTGSVTSTNVTTGLQTAPWTHTFIYAPVGAIAAGAVSFGRWAEYQYNTTFSNSTGGHAVNLMAFFKRTASGDPLLGISVEAKYENQVAGTQTEHDCFQANVSRNDGTIGALYGLNAAISGNAGTITAFGASNIFVSGNTGAITTYFGLAIDYATGQAGTVGQVFGLWFKDMFAALAFTPRYWVRCEDSYAPGITKSPLNRQTRELNTPTNGSTFTAAPYKDGVVLEHASLIAGMTIVLPTAGLIDMQEYEIWVRSAVTTPSFTGSGTIRNPPTTLVAGGVYRFLYCAGASGGAAWYCAKV